MGEFFASVIPETFRVFYEGSLYILLGFAIAGLLHEFLSTRWISRMLGGESARSVMMAALLGAPIPLCSCGVLPAAAELRKKGAGVSPTLAFLISTPETGVDSVALTYGLLGGVMALVRPVVAVLTALVAGLLSMVSPRNGEPLDDALLEELHLHRHAGAAEPSPGRSAAKRTRATRPLRWATARPRLQRAARYGFVTLLDELSFWLLVGLLLTGVLSAALPDDFFSTALGLGGGLLPMLVVMLAGVPLYLCASASTPVAAALVAKGLSPGAALVFLLVGPATNAATIAVVGRLLGRRQLRLYLGSIIGVSLAAGLLLDAVAGDLVRAAALGAREARDPALLVASKLLAAVGFTLLLLLSAQRTRFREGLLEAREQAARIREAAAKLGWRDALRPPVLGGAALLLALGWLPGALLVVEPGQRGVVQRFGRIVASDLEPGLHLHWPPPIGRGTAVDVDRTREVEVDPGAAGRVAYFVTADENLIDVRGIAYYRVSDPVRFAFGLEQADGIVKSLALRELLRIAAATPIDALYATERERTEQALRAGLAARIASLSLGLEIIDVRLLFVHAPGPIHEAFRDVASAVEDREREILEANAYAAEVTAAAGGESAALLEGARAARVRAQQLARGTTASFRGLADVHRTNPSSTETRLYLETLERSLSKPHKYVNGASGSGGELDLWIGSDGARTPAELVPSAPGRGPDRAQGFGRRTP
jgi:HflK protein